MTVASEITRIKTNIANAYIKAGERGAVLPDIQNSANLANCIFTIKNTGNDENAYSFLRRSVTSCIIQDGETEIVDQGFAGCQYLRNITIPESVTRIGNGAFNGCLRVDFEIPNTIKSIGRGAFWSCYSLGGDYGILHIPSSVETIGEDAFGFCEGLNELIIHKSEGSISGAPWGLGSYVKINWVGEN